MQQLLVNGYGNDVEFAQCDPCADFVDRDQLHHGYAYELETTACNKCCGEVSDPETILRGTTFPQQRD